MLNWTGKLGRSGRFATRVMLKKVILVLVKVGLAKTERVRTGCFQQDSQSTILYIATRQDQGPKVLHFYHWWHRTNNRFNDI
ncbi:hypothetical protein HanHA89_Chr05g0202941 [Helianthus annuus]|nr:hypothetical protein HanHA89_Chr05g0202941 [Helianthus annuus]